MAPPKKGGKPDKIPGLEASLSEMRPELQRSFEAMDKIKELARALLSSGSMIISIVSALQLPARLEQTPLSSEFRLAGSAAIILYVLLIITCVLVIRPATMSGPILPTEEELRKTFFKKKKAEILEAQLSAYLNAIKENAGPIADRKRLVTAASLLLPLVVLSLLAAALAP